MIDPKSTWRRELRARLRAQTPGDRTAASTRISTHLSEWPAPAAGQVLAAFLPLPSEPDLRPYYRRWEAAGGRLAGPRLTGPGLMEFRLLPPGSPETATGLRSGPHGLLEPDPALCPPVPPDALRLVLVPGLGFSRGGVRLGRGGGYYDRWLATLPPALPTIGVAFDLQIVADLPCEPHDRSVDHLVTETGWLPGARDRPPAPSPDAAR